MLPHHPIQQVVGKTRVTGSLTALSDIINTCICQHRTYLIHRTVGIGEEEGLTKIGSVTLEVGEVSGIMTDLFVDCWNYFKVKHPVLAESELKLVTIPAVTFCGNCGKTYETVKYGKECPYCHSGETWLVDGNQCVIKEIEAESAE